MSGIKQVSIERYGDERARVQEKLDDLHALAVEEERDLNEAEEAQATKYRSRIEELDGFIIHLATDIEREAEAVDVSSVVHREKDIKVTSESSPVYRTFAEYARDQLILHEQIGPKILPLMSGDRQTIREEAAERVERTLQNVTSTTVAGLIVPTHMTDILDIISRDRPVVASGRRVPLDRGSMTYPSIGTRPTVTLQSSEKTEAGTVAPTVTSNTLTASTYLGATNISWQAVNWSNPDVMSLYFDLAAEAYARQTESVACEAIETSAIGTVGTASGRLGTAGTESFAQWRAAVSAGISGIYTATGGRMRTNTLYLSANRFFQLATLGTDQVAQISPIGSLDIGSMSGNFFGLDVVGSYGFDQDTAVVGDRNALLVGENAGSPVEMRVIEPAIAGFEVGLVGAFASVVFDVNRFYHLGTHL